MRRDGFIGNERLISVIFDRIRANKLPHALLITGPSGSGKTSLAQLIAKAVCCDEKHKSGIIPCENCRSCRKADAKAHPDIHYLEKDPQKNTIRVDETRSFLSGFELTPNESDIKVYIINDGETLGKEAQNVLLKTLEEPIGNALFMILTESVSAMLPTVCSRCMTFSMERIDENTLARHLSSQKGVDAQTALKAARLSGGYVGAAYEILSDKGGFTGRDTAMELLSKLAKSDKAGALAVMMSKSVCTKEALIEIYSEMQLAMRDIASKDYGIEHPDFFFTKEESEELRRRFSVSKALSFYDALAAEKSELSANGNPGLSALRIISAL